jgi:phosphatidylinositol dimannoside acyltransferase
VSARHLALGNTLKLCAVRAAGWGIQHAPQVARTLARPAGDAAFLLNGKARAAVYANLRGLRRDDSDAAIVAAARGVFRSVALYYVELMSLPVSSAAVIERRAIVTGYEHVTALLDEGKGVILCGSHTGPGELILQAFAARGVHCTAVVERLSPPQVNAYFLQARESFGHRYVFPDFAGFKQLIRVLRAGGMVALLVDRDVLGTGIEATFCGRRLRAPTGAIELAAITGAPVLPATVFWRADGRLDVTILPPLRIDRQARRGPARRAEVERLLAVFRDHVREHADQWLVLQPFWSD